MSDLTWGGYKAASKTREGNHVHLGLLAEVIWHLRRSSSESPGPLDGFWILMSDDGTWTIREVTTAPGGDPNDPHVANLSLGEFVAIIERAREKDW